MGKGGAALAASCQAVMGCGLRLNPGIRRIVAFGADYVLIATYIMCLVIVNLSNSTTDLVVPTDFADKFNGHLIAFLTLTCPVYLYFVLFKKKT